MNSKRMYYVLLATVCLLIAGLVGGAYGATGILEQRSQKLKEARFKSQSLETQQTQLAKAEKDIEKYRSLGRTARELVPQDKDQAQTVREIVKIAQASGVKLGAITFPVSELGAKKPATPATPSGDSKATAPTQAPLTQIKPVAGMQGVFSLAITVSSDSDTLVPYANFLRMLEGLEKNRRTALVSGINIVPDATRPDMIQFTLNIDEYIKP